MIKTICYISNKKSDLSQSDIDSLMDFVINTNNRINITGVLISKNRHFFQIMEGEAQVIDSTFDNIKIDTRHYGLIKLLETEVEDRLFEDYDGGDFGVIREYGNLKKLKIYFDWIKEANILAVDELIELTTNFIKHNK